MQQIPLFSISEFTTWRQTFEQDVALYARLGVSGIEVCERKLSSDPAAARDQLAMLGDAGLAVTSVQPRVHALYRDGMCPELEDPKERMARYRQSIDLFSQAFPGENLPLVTITGAAPALNFREAHKTARLFYRDLADYAADRGMRIMLEPLHPILMNVDTFICTLAEARTLIEDVNRPAGFGLMLDVWHLWREAAIRDSIRGLGNGSADHPETMIFGVHVSDWPAAEPRHVADRVLPGDGIIDLPAMLGATEAAGYRGAYCLEIFSLEEFPDSLWRQDPGQVISRGKEGFTSAWRARKK